MSEKMNRPSHVTRTDVFDDLGFSKAEAAALKIKAKILTALLGRIRQAAIYPGPACRDS
jgi:predicted XRE-type DNA-binding protein